MRPEFSYFLHDWIIDLIETSSLVFRGSLPLSASQLLSNIYIYTYENHTKITSFFISLYVCLCKYFPVILSLCVQSICLCICLCICVCYYVCLCAWVYECQYLQDIDIMLSSIWQFREINSLLSNCLTLGWNSGHLAQQHIHLPTEQCFTIRIYII